MMKKIKGCGNESCMAHKKKIIYNETESFCSKCGRPLVCVCKDCYTLLPNDSMKYCVRCLAKHADRKVKVKKRAALAVGGVVLTFGKKAFDVVKKIKG